MARPLVKWAGGRTWLVPVIKDLYEKSGATRLIEPFAGGMAITLGVTPMEAKLNDINSHLINLYNQIQCGMNIDMEMINGEEFYYKCRKRFNTLIKLGSIHNPEMAQLFYYLNKTGFNGLCRFNAKGLYNVPYGKYKSINYATDFDEYTKLFENWQFICGDYSNVHVTDVDFTYADPPYDDVFTNYAAGGFSWDDQKELAEWLSACRGVVVTSNSYTERIVDLYNSLGFQVSEVSAPRRISADGNRDRVSEMLAWKGIG